jgi:hypothetical protein
MDKEYNFFNTLNYIKSRSERFNMERLFGLVCIHTMIHGYGYPDTVGEKISMLGDIRNYPRWGMTWKTYLSETGFKDQHDQPAYLVKVFTGR